jgi:quercetin dioxygenase-like cupin family protein
MKTAKLADMKGGWFIGDFAPVCIHTKGVEASCKYYKAGDKEGEHVHKIATEVTVIASGKVKMNGQEYSAGDIIVLDPGDATDFHALEDTVSMVVKIPSVIGDKYLV